MRNTSVLSAQGLQRHGEKKTWLKLTMSSRARSVLLLLTFASCPSHVTDEGGFSVFSWAFFFLSRPRCSIIPPCVAIRTLLVSFERACFPPNAPQNGEGMQFRRVFITSHA